MKPINYAELTPVEREPYIAALRFEDKMQLMNAVHSHYMMDIEQIWKRSTVFLLLNAALLTIIFAKDGISNLNHKVLFSAIALLVSIIWSIVSIISSKWIKTWRDKFVEIESYTNPFVSFAIGEMKKTDFRNKWGRPQIYSNSLALISAAFWFIVLGMHTYDLLNPISQVGKNTVVLPVNAPAKTFNCKPQSIAQPRPANC